ncbi:MAG: winged helix-turn-helix transcriptional regulator [Clostridiales bacterium]|nr:winged helix-turn-helix transcriptional regulator [Clostridiales bacterium]
METTDLGVSQEAILEFIISELNDKGYPPSVREICQGVGLKSTSTVHGHLKQLEKKGYIRRDPTKPRAIEVLNNNMFLSEKKIMSIPIMGNHSNSESTFPIYQEYIGDRTCIMLTFQGSNIPEAGILDGDLIVISIKDSLKDNDLVAITEDNETIADIMYYNLLKSSQVDILGKVIGVFRMFKPDME